MIFFRVLLLSCFAFLLAHGISVEEAKKDPLQAYIISDQNFNENGIRVGPLDLKYENSTTLSKYQLQQDLVTKLQPYVGLKGNQAQQALQSKPLKLSQNEYDVLVNQVKAYWSPKLDRLPSGVKNNPSVQKLVQQSNSNNWVDFLQEVSPIRDIVSGKKVI